MKDNLYHSHAETLTLVSWTRAQTSQHQTQRKSVTYPPYNTIIKQKSDKATNTFAVKEGYSLSCKSNLDSFVLSDLVPQHTPDDYISKGEEEERCKGPQAAQSLVLSNCLGVVTNENARAAPGKKTCV